MKIVRHISAIIIISSLFSCGTFKKLPETNTTILPFGDTVKITEGSLVYALPLSVLHFTVTVEHEIERPGPYYRYASELLGLKDVISEADESWTIKKIDVSTYEELDPAQFYIIESNTLLQFNALSLRKEGLILDLNPEIYNRNLDTKSSVYAKSSDIGFKDMGSDEYYEVKRDTSYRVVEIDTAFIRIPYLVEKKKPLTIDLLAENAAKTLLELRDGKQMILTGEANVYPQDNSAITEMNKLENDYLSLFVGKRVRETITYNYDLIPEKASVTPQIALFKFSELTGVVSTSAQGGSTVYVELIPTQKTKNLNIVTKLQPSVGEALKYDKLYYRIPDVVNVRVGWNKEVLSESRKLLYQYGSVMQLPANYIIGK
jgi:hypothetical protein